MLMFVVSNLVGSTIQITTLPLPVLSTLQAVSLRSNLLAAHLTRAGWTRLQFSMRHFDTWRTFYSLCFLWHRPSLRWCLADCHLRRHQRTCSRPHATSDAVGTKTIYRMDDRPGCFGCSCSRGRSSIKGPRSVQQEQPSDAAISGHGIWSRQRQLVRSLSSRC